ncbi:hypothetical protein Q7P37_011430 [Cladosporium fusiforme]
MIQDTQLGSKQSISETRISSTSNTEQEATTAADNSNSTNPTMQPQPFAIRLHIAYTGLTFKNDSQDPQDAQRETLFARLMQHHLARYNIFTTHAWEARSIDEQDKIIYDFIVLFGDQLWPGKKAARAHLAVPNVRDRKARSFICSFDSHWSQRRNGIRSGHPSTLAGARAESKVGKALMRYVSVLLLPGVQARVEDEQSLVEGILRV